MYLTPKKAQPRMIVATSHPVIALRPALVCAAADSQRHGQTTGDQHDGVEGAPADAEEVRASGKGFNIFVAIHGIGTKQPPEEQDFLD